MAAHDCSDRSQVGRAAGCLIEDRGDLAEVLGAEDAGSDDRQRLGTEVAGVRELVAAPRGIQSTSPAPTSCAWPSTVQTSVPSRP